MIQVSRADILRLLFNQQEIADCVELFGYELKPSKKVEFKVPETHSEKVVESEETLPIKISSSDIDFDYFVLEREEKLLTKQENIKEEVAWVYEPEKEQIPKALLGKEYPKKSRPLFNWQSLRGRLQERLATDQKRNQIDVKLVVNKIAKVETLRTLPKRTKKRQASNLHLIRDHTDERLRPVFRDFIALAQKLISFFGEHYLKEKTLRHQDNLLALLRTHREKHALSYLQGARAVIVLSDLGLYLPNDSVLNQWLAFAQIARAYSCHPIAILPVPAHYLDARVTTAFECICMESGDFITTKNEPDLKKRQENIVNDREKAKDTLLSALASSPRIDPHLLRATRDLFPEECNVATEILAWQHPDVHSNPSFVCLRPERPNTHLVYLKRLKDLDLAKQIAIRQNFVDYHGLFYKEKLILELSLLDSVCGFKDELSEYCILEHKNIARRLKKNPDVTRRNFVHLQVVQRYTLEQQLKNSPDKVKNNYTSVMVALLKQHTKANDVSLEPWVDKDIFSYLQEPEDITANSLSLLQFPDHLSLVTKQDSLPEAHNNLLPQGNPITTFFSQTRRVFITSKYENSVPKEQFVDLNSDLSLKFELTNLEQLDMQFIESEQSVFLHVTRQLKSTWASAIASKKKILQTAKTQKGNYYFQPEEKTVQEDIVTELESYWYPTTQKLLKPNWADAIGNDAYGLYTDLVVKNTKQRFRWIEPGEFWMGSPENEKDHQEDEARHRVRVSKGFWLAETTCTQALWQAVMENNPSNFKGNDLPVEKVSWNDTKDFMRKLNGLTEGLNLRLPTEAEWEYACRVGTETPFAYGKEADAKLMNISGNKTVPVKGLYQNDWGLFQMHGNVLEWCEDWYKKKYDMSNSDEPIIDPRGPNTGTLRVLRGGSWNDFARYCRSAYRSRRAPADRYGNYGFRLVSGHQEKTE